ncbi:MAG: response regulator [Rhodobacterales bacterium]|nr:MAG: response regulator [Rhodobacterales bacterium]
MTSLDDLLEHRPPTPERPLLGLTMLLVEDSRFTCEALRLMCLRSGARLRRAGSLHHARRHLSTYRPGAVLIDLGLPDGDGASLIQELASAAPRVGAVLATSGDPDGRERAEAAGADAFMPKPVTSLAMFQNTVLSALPRDRRPPGPRLLPQEEIAPDPIALRDDLSHAAALLAPGGTGIELEYAAQFLASLGKAAGDGVLRRAGEELSERLVTGRPVGNALSRLNTMVTQMLSETRCPMDA